MDTSFLTIAEACDKTGRSPSTVRRLIHALAQDDHVDRAAIEPSPTEVLAFKKKGENFTWRIREDVLQKHFASAPKEAKKTKVEPTGDIFSILQRELELKNQQIEKQWEVIHSLNDRLREGNILMGSLQKRLSLPEAPSPAESIVDAVATPEKKSSKKPSAKTVKPSKKGLFGWLRV